MMRAMAKRRGVKPMFSLAPVEFRNSSISGRGVFARRRFEPGDLVVAYAPKQRKVDADSDEAIEASGSKLTLLSERAFVIIPDITVPGGWLCNHSCRPNADLYSDREGRIQCTRPIAPGEEITIFYGWVTENEPGRDACLCRSPACLGFINFDVSDDEALHADADTPAGDAFRRRLADYESFLRSIGQDHVLGTIMDRIARMKRGRAL
jgi:SET domain-containing protein